MSDDDLDSQLELARLRAQEREFVEREKREEEFGLLIGAGIAAAAWAHDRAQPEPKARKPKRARGRLISDWPKVYQEVVAEMRRDHDALEWLNVVTRVRSNFPQASSVVESTIRRWCTEDNLPHPKDLVTGR